ncbi:DUF418 domain-containing protein [Pseudovibrio sp. Tun.PSC04-5.I4]|uniref:DUF418 domain-containing protein n=1 Tax=Pseudovibrio sp. Tun.PSC04-5.I4 TaxID=1798213 RepID=UPI000888AF64|nr:DUF418 domain-containing protein [Pseudovibrio sp. Tun.PSC04-5.I4]SDQ72960.1 Uncharacterized membrane protein YeiB [Pseudovibrio sp. Tun.PSC04-5.I4]
MNAQLKPSRLEGLDLARFIAFVGMVIVNFSIVMGAEGAQGGLGFILQALEGRAAATFVVLAGVGLGLAAQLGDINLTAWVTVKRALFLLALGLLNMLIFDADILHYYAFYFLFGVMLLKLNTRALIGVILAIVFAALALVFLLDYDAGWNWSDYTYQGFWTPLGFVRNLFFNGWHPVIPWLAFLLFGIVLSRLSLSETKTQRNLMIGGLIGFIAANLISLGLEASLFRTHFELAVLAGTSPIPPMPMYMAVGMSAASFVIGLCLLLAKPLARIKVLAVLNPAGRQTLTLYIAHILLGMGTLEELGLLGGQTLQTSMLASALFCAITIIYAYIWSRFFKRGPIEALMRKVAG